MKVLVVPEIEGSKRAAHARRVVQKKLSENSATLIVKGRRWELVAILIPADNEDNLDVAFALQTTADKKLRAMIPVSETKEAFTFKEVVAQPADCIDPELFLEMLITASNTASEMAKQGNPNTAH